MEVHLVGGDAVEAAPSELAREPPSQAVGQQPDQARKRALAVIVEASFDPWLEAERADRGDQLVDEMGGARMRDQHRSAGASRRWKGTQGVLRLWRRVAQP